MTYYIDKKDVPNHFQLPDHARKYSVNVSTTVNIPVTAGMWDGGSIDRFYMLNLSTGDVMQMPQGGKDKISLEPGFAFIRHSVFCGKDVGLNFIVHPDNAALFPKPASNLTKEENIVLYLIASYIPKVRIQEAETYYGVSKDMYREIVTSLKDKGLVNGCGAITTAGKNAVKRPEYPKLGM